MNKRLKLIMIPAVALTLSSCGGETGTSRFSGETGKDQCRLLYSAAQVL